MESRTNKEIVQAMYEALDQGRSEVFLDSLADNIHMKVMGNTIFSGDFHGKEDVVEHVLKPMAAALDGGLRMTANNFIAENEFVVVQALGQAKTIYGGRYDNEYCQVLRLEDGKVVEFIEYLDTALINHELDRT
jgi:ketosteroid isomerase-like protein